MTLWLSLYDFFAYMIPGVFYILVVAGGLNIFGFISINETSLNNSSLFTFLILLGVGYVLGQLIDPVAYKWLGFFKGKSRTARVKTFTLFQAQNPELELQFNPKDWSILLSAIKIQKPGISADIEQHNALSIMLRNLSFGLFISSLILVLTFITVNTHWGNLLLAGAALFLSSVALKRSALRRDWFYTSILEVFVTNYLLQEKTLITKLNVINDKIETSTQAKSLKAESNLDKPE